MKKKFLALAALLCSATVCATVGAAVMNNNVQTVSAEATTSTWTDTATGTTYTFEGDISKFSTTDIGEIAASTNYSKVLGTEVGYTGGAVSNWAENDDCLIYLTDQAWTKTTNGIHFSFETNNVWRRPAGTDAGTNTSETTATRIEIYYGDLRLYLVREGNNLKPEIWSRGTSTLTLTAGTNSNADTSMVHASANYNWFNANTKLQDGWAEVKISKYACTNAAGYWLKIAYTKPNQPQAFDSATGAVVVFDGYVAQPMTTDEFDNFAIKNATLDTAAKANYKVVNEADKNYDCKLSIRRGDKQVTATVDTETYSDAADVMDKYLQGFNRGANNGKPYTEDDFLTDGKGNDNSFGLELRTKAINVASHNTGEWPLMAFNAGTTYFYMSYNPNEKQVTFQFVSFGTGAETTIKKSSALRFYYDWKTDAYAWRITRMAVRSTNGTDDGKGAIVRLYMGKIDATTNMPVAGWDTRPVFEVYDYNARQTNDAGRNGLSIGAKFSATPYVVNYSSNKYVALKTIVGENVTTNKVELGSSYTLADLTSDTMLHIGWSKGASEYSADDFVAKNTTITVKESATYTALALKMNADKTADLRFRKRAENNNELEISLQWDVSSEDIGNVGYYFGNITYGYKITSNNGKNSGDVDCMELLTTDGVSAPYAYSVIQSGITDSNMEFTFQAYVKFMVDGEVFAIAYTAETDMATYGTSVKDVATAALTDEAYAELTAEEQALIQAKAQ